VDVFSSCLEAIMRVSLRSMLTGAVLAGGAAIMAAAVATPAVAEDSQVHVLTVQLPGGGVEQIQYTGDVAPQVVLVPAPRMVTGPVVAPLAGIDPFVELERISALMDQQAAAMLRQVENLQGGMIPRLPPGASGYSFVSTMSGNGACTRSVQITYSGSAAQPRMVFSTSGDCSPDRRQHAPTEVTVPAPFGRPNPKPGTIEVKGSGQRPDGGTLRRVALAR
jgi:hypothetical protein